MCRRKNLYIHLFTQARSDLEQLVVHVVLTVLTTMSTCFNSPSFWSYPKVITALSFLSLILVIFVPVLFRLVSYFGLCIMQTVSNLNAGRLLLLSSANSFYRYYFALLSNILAWSWTMAALIAHGCQLRGLDNEDFLLTLNLFCIGKLLIQSFSHITEP